MPPLDPQVLLAVLELASEAYGAAVLRILRERGDLPVSETSVYRALGRLESEGLLRSEAQVIGSGARRRRARVYSLTPSGSEAVENLISGVRETYRALGARVRAF